MIVSYWRLSGFYFFYFATLGAFLPYWSLYLKNSGFAPAAIGELMAVLAGTRIIAPNLWSWIADRSGKNLRIVRTVSFLAALIFTGFLFLQGYLWFVVLTFAFSLFWNSALPQYEAATLYHLKAESYRYSRIRLWGSVGFIVAVFTIGWLIDRYGVARLPFIVVVLLSLIWLSSFFPPEVKQPKSEIKSAGLLCILKKPEVIAFFAACLLLQIAHGAYYAFYSIYLKQHHYSTGMTALLWALGVVAEILLFVFMPKLLKRYSLQAILMTSLWLAALRWVAIAWGARWLAVLIAAQLLHAASFGAAHAVAIHKVHQYFGDHHQNKGQALYSSLSFGLGGMMGSLGSGYYWQSLGGQWVYSMASLCCLIAIIIADSWPGRNDGKMD
jgi:PPP family 3-phenylpropionic acid transporter